MRCRVYALWAVVALLVGCKDSAATPARELDAGVQMLPESGVDAGYDSGIATTDGSAPVEVTAELAALVLPSVVLAPADPSNRFADDSSASAFGKQLFFDPSFAGRLLDGDNDGSPQALGLRGQTGKVACAGCHLPESDFSDTRSLRQQISFASGWGKRRAPSLLDVAQTKLFMWDGRHDALYNQIFSVIESAVEMNSSRLYAAQQVFTRHRTAYEAIFGPMPPLDDTARFPALAADRTGCSLLDQNLRVCKGEWHGVPGDQAEFDGMARLDQDAVTRVVVNVGKALGSYERLLSCGQSRFDRWARGEAGALTIEEQRGGALFVGKAKCVSCHSGPFFSDEQFHNVGLKPAVVGTVFIDADDHGASVGLLEAQQDSLNTRGVFSDGDDGRLPTTLAPQLDGAFRTPRLRCLSKRPSFMHTAQLRTVMDVVLFFDRGGDQAGFPGTSEIAPLGLTAQERSDLVAFLGALDGPGPRPELLTP